MPIRWKASLSLIAENSFCLSSDQLLSGWSFSWACKGVTPSVNSDSSGESTRFGTDSLMSVGCPWQLPSECMVSLLLAWPEALARYPSVSSTVSPEIVEGRSGNIFLNEGANFWWEEQVIIRSMIFLELSEPLLFPVARSINCRPFTRLAQEGNKPLRCLLLLSFFCLKKSIFSCKKL